MKLSINPNKSDLGIASEKHETYSNEKGDLNVIFRYDYSKLSLLTKGFQVQIETISPNEYRGNHYHYPELAGEEFFLVSGYVALIASNLDSSVIEMYLLKEKTTYYVPALIAHKVQNIGYIFNNNYDAATLIISKHYNYKIENLQKPFVIPEKLTDEHLYKLVEGFEL